jgi:hypothetical protein
MSTVDRLVYQLNIHNFPNLVSLSYKLNGFNLIFQNICLIICLLKYIISMKTYDGKII